MTVNGHDTIEREVDKTAPALFVKTAQQVGTRMMEMSFAVPLDMTPADLNAYVDKVTSVMDRQGDKAALEQEVVALKNAEMQLRTNADQLANQQQRDATDWDISNKRGDFRPTESQRKQYENWQKNSIHLRETIIPRHRKNIEALEQRINGNG